MHQHERNWLRVRNLKSVFKPMHRSLFTHRLDYTLGRVRLSCHRPLFECVANRLCLPNFSGNAHLLSPYIPRMRIMLHCVLIIARWWKTRNSQCYIFYVCIELTQRNMTMCNNSLAGCDSHVRRQVLAGEHMLSNLLDGIGQVTLVGKYARSKSAENKYKISTQKNHYCRHTDRWNPVT